MLVHAHAGLGWAVGVLAPGSDRRLRACCLAAATLPDIDSLVYLAGPDAFARWHHTFGHNVFFGLIVVAAAAWLHRGRRVVLAGALAALCFASHLVADAYLSPYPVYAWWPFSGRALPVSPGMWLGSTVNILLAFGAVLLVLALAVRRKVTPVEVFSPRLDRLVVAALRRRGENRSISGGGV